jgi:hypothetical protein
MHFDYDILSEGQVIGDLKISRTFSADNHEENIAMVSKIHISGWWGEASIRTQSLMLFRSLKPVNFDHKVTQDGKSFYIRGEQQDQDIWASAIEVKTQKQMSDEEFTGTALSILSEFVPPVGVALSIGSALDEGDKREKGHKIPLSAFDLTPETLPRFAQENGYHFSNDKFSVLESNELTIEPYILNTEGEEVLFLNENKLVCHKIAIQKPKGHSIYWIAEQDGIAFLVKEKGEDDDGPYKIMLKNVK